MPWYILALLVSVPVIALSTWASRKGNLPLVLAMLAVALVFVGATHGWVPRGRDLWMCRPPPCWGGASA